MTTMLPAGLQYGSVEWTVVGIAEDDEDPDALPNPEQVNGTVTFEAWVQPDGAIRYDPDTEEPSVTILPRPQTFSVVDGRLVSKTGDTPIRLVASNSPGISPQGWQYKVSYDLNDGYSFGSFFFPLLAGELVNLTEAFPQSTPNDPVLYVKGDTGDAATVEVGSVTTGPAGSAASATNEGDEHHAILAFVIPRGDTGEVSQAELDAAVAGLDGRLDPIEATLAAATNAPTADTLVKRNASGNTGANRVYGWIGPPATADELTRKDYVDALGTAADTANTVMRRDANGATNLKQLLVTAAVPSNAAHATRKDYVDGVAALKAPIAASVQFVNQNGDGTWPNRPTSRVDVKVFWTRTVAGSADPVAAVSPAVDGAYANDLVVGAV